MCCLLYSHKPPFVQELRSFLFSFDEGTLLPLDQTLTVKQNKAAWSNRLEAAGLLAAVAFAAAAYTLILQ